MSKKILVVDDEPLIVKIVESRLKANGYEVVTAFDGEEALNKARAETPQLVVLDLMLPKIGGYEVCRRLKSEIPDLPVVMLTAKGEIADMKQGMQQGADSYVTKPFNAEVLLGIIQGILGE